MAGRRGIVAGTSNKGEIAGFAGSDCPGTASGLFESFQALAVTGGFEPGLDDDDELDEDGPEVCEAFDELPLIWFI
jgi:hypothetical protein